MDVNFNNDKTFIWNLKFAEWNLQSALYLYTWTAEYVYVMRHAVGLLVEIFIDLSRTILIEKYCFIINWETNDKHTVYMMGVDRSETLLMFYTSFYLWFAEAAPWHHCEIVVKW